MIDLMILRKIRKEAGRKQISLIQTSALPFFNYEGIEEREVKSKGVIFS